MVYLSNVTHTELESDLVHHVHDECEVLYELRGNLFTGKQTNPSVVEIREPVHEPEFEHEAAVDLILDLLEELLLH